MTNETITKSQKTCGIICPHCGHKTSRVLYTRPIQGGRLRRRRKCLACGQRLTTHEVIVRQ